MHILVHTAFAKTFREYCEGLFLRGFCKVWIRSFASEAGKRLLVKNKRRQCAERIFDG